MGKRGAASIEKQAYTILQSINGITGDREEIFNFYKDKIVDNEGNRREVHFSELSNDGKFDFRKFKLEDGKKLNEKVIFSINTFQDTLIKAKHIGNWMKEFHFENKRFQFNFITPDQFVSFLDFKKEEGVAVQTLRSYKFVIAKILAGLESKGWLNDSYDYSVIKNYDTGQREDSFRVLLNEQVDKMVSHAIEKDYKWAKALKLQRMFGLRVQELINLRPEHILFGEQPVVHTRKFGAVDTSNTIFIEKSKGGLSRYLSMPQDPQALDFLRELKESTNRGKIFKGLKRNYYCRFMGRLTTELFGFNCMKTHEVRKAWASQRYIDEKRELEHLYNRALSPAEKDSLMGNICKDLGHGSSRNDLKKIYIKSNF